MNNHEPIKLLLKPVFHFLILTNKIRKQTCTVSVTLPISRLSQNIGGSQVRLRVLEHDYMLVTYVVDKNYE